MSDLRSIIAAYTARQRMRPEYSDNMRNVNDGFMTGRIKIRSEKTKPSIAVSDISSAIPGFTGT